MADDNDVLLKMYDEERTQARHSESQRSIITNFIILIASAITGFIVQQKMSLETRPLSLLLCALGIYGVITSEKLYERSQFHFERARFYRRRIDEFHKMAQIEKLRKLSNKTHRAKYPILGRIHLHYFWTLIHIIIIIGGLLLYSCAK